MKSLHLEDNPLLELTDYQMIDSIFSNISVEFLNIEECGFKEVPLFLMKNKSFKMVHFKGNDIKTISPLLKFEDDRKINIFIDKKYEILLPEYLKDKFFCY